MLPAIIILAFPDLILGVFGREFIDGSAHLQLLALFNFIVALLGPFSMVLNMIDGENFLMKLSIATLLIGLVMFPLATFSYGMMGFILAYGVAVVVPNVLISIVVLYRLKRV